MSRISPRSYTPDDVLKLSKPTDGFLCPLSANTWGLEFLQFTIRLDENLHQYIWKYTMVILKFSNKYFEQLLLNLHSDYETKNVIFEVGRDLPPPSDISIDLSAVGNTLNTSFLPFFLFAK